MKVFISGPMSGKPYYNRAAFFKAEEELEKHGYSVWNPAWMAYPSDTEFTKDDIHIIDFAALRRCDAIYMLKGWKRSKGAQEECEYAIMRGLIIMYEGVHCWGKEPEFDKEFAYDEAIKNRTNYQLEAIKENIKESRNETRYKCNGLNRAINNVEADLDNFKDETDGKMDDIYDTLHRHGENIDSCQYDIRSIGRRLNNNHAVNANKIHALKKEVETIKKSIGTDNLQEQLEKDFADVYEEFQNTKDKVNDIEYGYIDWSSKMSSAIEEMEKVKKTVKGLNSLVATLGERNEILSDDIYELQRIIISSDIENISIKAMNQKLIDLGRELDVYIDDYKEAYKQLNNADEALERRIKALEDNRGALHEELWTEIHRLSKEIDALKDRPDFNYNGYRNDCEALDRKISHNHQRCNDLDDMIGNLISNYSRDIGSIKLKLSDDSKAVNNTLNDFNIRLKAIEKRLDIKPFYAPTEDEKDD